MRLLTIGGYGFTQASFLDALKRAGVDTLVDIRQRRGMRGSTYAFLNSLRLQQMLASAGVRYVHAVELAPTASVRDAQKQDDAATGTAKRDRTRLSLGFIQKYRSEVLSAFDATALRDALGGARAAALFCVEGNPAACHRSLAAEHLSHVLGCDAPVENLKP